MTLFAKTSGKVTFSILFLILLTFPSRDCKSIESFGSLEDKELSLSAVKQILQEDNEILDEKEELISEGQIETRKKKKSARTKLPAYLETLGDKFLPQMKGSYESGEDNGNYEEPLARVWLPVDIQDIQMTPLGTGPSATETTIHFQQTKVLGGGFTKCEIVLTLKSDVALNGSFYVQIIGEDYEAIPISIQKRFYSFTITKYVQKRLEQKRLEHPHEISVSFQILNENRELSDEMSFYDVFDVQVERPFIIFFYLDSNSVSSEIPQIQSRRRRSLAEEIQAPIGNEITSCSDGSCGTEVPIPISNQNQTEGNNTESNQDSATPTPPVTEMPPPAPLPPVNDDRPNHICQRVSWVVDTEEIDWFDAVAPRRIDLGYCAGSCQYPLQNDYYNFTLHGFFMDRYRLNKVFNVPRNLPRSRCVPVSYKPIRIWIKEEENSIINREVPNVIVDHCGCR